MPGEKPKFIQDFESFTGLSCEPNTDRTLTDEGEHLYWVLSPTGVRLFWIGGFHRIGSISNPDMDLLRNLTPENAAEQLQSSIKKYANPWEQLYSEEICSKFKEWYWYKDIFWHLDCSRMTSSEKYFLNYHNPFIDNVVGGHNLIFQYLSEETRNRLEPEIAKLVELIATSTSRSDFDARYDRLKLGGQLPK